MAPLTILLSLIVPAKALDCDPNTFPDVDACVTATPSGGTVRFTGTFTDDFLVSGKTLDFEAANVGDGWVGTMTVTGGANVTIRAMTLSGGAEQSDPAEIESGRFCLTQTDQLIDADSAQVTIEDSTIQCYGADAGASPIDVTNSTLTIRGSDFRYNYYTGVVSHVGGDLLIEDSTFEYNANAGHGGAVFSSGDSSTIERTNFYANSTVLGGGAGAYVASDIMLIDSNEFLNNYDLVWFIPGLIITDPDDLYGVGDVAGLTVGVGEGAGLYVEDPAGQEATSTYIHNNQFCGNLADSGAGLYVNDVKGVNIRNNKFAENWSMHYGGAMYVVADDAWDTTAGEEAVIVNNTFLLNTAGLIPPPYTPLVTVIGGGGALALDGTVVDFRNNIVAYTEFGGGMLGVDGADYTIGDLLTMDYNILFSNCDGEGGCSESDPLSWQHFTGDLNQISLPSTNIQLDPFPLYFGGGEFNCFPDAFYPEWESPAVRNGDAANEPNKYSPLYSDIGAYGGPDADVLDRDADTFENIYDCNDELNSGELVYPGAPEICDQLDNDCDGVIDEGFDTLWYPDGDKDGFGDVNIVQPFVTCNTPAGYVLNRDDCDDDDPSVNPGQAEICDGLDNDCDFSRDGGLPFLPLWQDLDGDTYGAGEQYNGCEAQDGNQGLGHYYITDPTGGDPYLVVSGYVANSDDCNDFNSNISPSALEVCDDLDNNCNDIVDDASDGGQLYYPDGDGDGFGTGDGTYGCSPPDSAAVTAGNDCDDFNDLVSPAAEEECDGIDNNCDGLVDKEAVDAPLLYEDLDNDGLGNPATGVRDCNPGPTFTTQVGTDCDDNDPSVGECVECGCRAAPTTGSGLAGLVGLAMLARRRRRA